MKLFSFLRYLIVCYDISGLVGKHLDKKPKVDFKIYDVMNWEANITAVHILPSISRSKGNQAVKFNRIQHKKYFS